VANIEGVPFADRKNVARFLRRRGWSANFAAPGANDVPVKLVHPEASQVHEFDPDWPLAVSRSDLAGEFVYTRMSRRDEIQLRRNFLRGLAKIFQETRERSSGGGCGYWLAPHLWFVAGLTRDEVTEIVGPPYAEVFTLPVRRYIYKLLKALRVDLIFVEYGVSFRKLIRVFRLMFEVYDKGAGKKRCDDVQFQGVTKVRVMFHDFDVDEPFRSSRYPEPKFAPLARLRVMHIFRDRGGEEEFIEPPFSCDQSPAPVLLGV
jgi:hypothetical protein